MNDNGFYFWLSVIANCCQIESYQMLLKDADNNQLMQFLQHQDSDYLQTIIDQNKKIIQQNEEIINLLKEGK
jgi:hypothetical protein